MNREDIIRMAQEAGIDAESDTLCRYEGWVEPLERFFHAAYAAGAAAERDKYEAKFKQLEALMQVREQQPNKPCCLAEREACAKVCEAEGQRIDASWQSCAAAIRERDEMT